LIGVGIGIVTITTVVAMIDHHTVVLLPLDVKMVMTTGLLSILGYGTSRRLSCCFP
jgi:hypothetical protein